MISTGSVAGYTDLRGDESGEGEAFGRDCFLSMRSVQLPNQEVDEYLDEFLDEPGAEPHRSGPKGR